MRRPNTASASLKGLKKEVGDWTLERHFDLSVGAICQREEIGNTSSRQYRSQRNSIGRSFCLEAHPEACVDAAANPEWMQSRPFSSTTRFVFRQRIWYSSRFGPRASSSEISRESA